MSCGEANWHWWPAHNYVQHIHSPLLRSTYDWDNMTQVIQSCNFCPGRAEHRGRQKPRASLRSVRGMDPLGIKWNCPSLTFVKVTICKCEILVRILADTIFNKKLWRIILLINLKRKLKLVDFFRYLNGRDQSATNRTRAQTNVTSLLTLLRTPNM